VPPQDANNIVVEMTRLERFINDNKASALDPLVKMAIIHHQFESIHPFPDGNGRIGRIINVLYLVQQELLDTPILYMSRYININKSTYYALLQSVREDSDWEPWLHFILAAVAETAADSVVLVRAIRDLMAGYKNALRDNFPKIYSQDLLNNLFRHPYTRVGFLQNELQVSRPAATKYLDALTQGGLLKKFTSGRNNYYGNVPLIALLARNSD
jgi:Fic family protein